MPLMIRLEHNDDTSGTADLYIQPSFTAVDRTNTVGYVSNIAVKLKRRTDESIDDSRSFFWVDTGRWKLAEDSPGAVNQVYEYLADPTPIIVTPDAPQSPSVLLRTLGGKYVAGVWDGVLVVSRSASLPAIRTPFCVEISAEEVEHLNRNPNRELRYRNDTNLNPDQRLARCYRLG
jgi:hypothetical protein